MESFAELFDFSRFMPHGMCFLWRPDLLLLHVGSDILIALAYFSIPAAIFFIVRARPGTPAGIPILFGAFILLCGVTHVASIVVIWYPVYVIEGLFKLATAIVSVITAIALWPLLPRVLALPTRQELELRNTEIEELNRRLQHRIDSLGTLAGGVSHDFNNLLTVIRGYAQLLQDKTGQEQDKEALDAIIGSANRAADVCQQMLAYSGRGHFMLVATDLNKVIEEINLPTDPGCDVTLSLSSTLEEINAAPSQIEQMIRSLTTNGIEAIGESGKVKGEITVSTYRTTFSEEDLQGVAFETAMTPGDAIVLEVSDNGSGMPPEVAERLFEPYFSTRFTGRGLGMAAVSGIVRGHGGCLFLRTNPGGGTMIRIGFPIRPSETIQYREPRTPSPSLVLIVDDEAEIVTLARNYFDQLGIESVSAMEPDEALRLARKHKGKLHAAIVDYLMPHTTGSELLRDLVEIAPVDAYITSGYSRGEIDDPTMRELLCGFIQKPFSSRDFSRLFRPGQKPA